MVTNLKELARSALRKKALRIVDAGYAALEIESVIKNRIALKGDVLSVKFFDSKNKAKKVSVDLSEFRKVALIGFGKGSALACFYIAKILGRRLTNGIALDVVKLKTGNLKLNTLVGTHPLPSEDNVKATQKVIALAKRLTEKDLLIVFTCGGGSALATATEDELAGSLLATKDLTKAGADIIELNTVRKHLSISKGGGFARIAYPARVISLIASDVLGNDLSMVASGPLVMDKTSKPDAERILRKYGLNPNQFKLLETPKDQKLFRRVENILFVKNQDAATAMQEEAKKLGFKSKTESLVIKGEAENIFLPLIKKTKSREAFIAAGETTVTLKDKKLGKGGRNQEAVLGALGQLKTDILITSFASDAHDNTEAAGAIGDYLTMEKAKKLKLNPKSYLASHDSFRFFQKTNDLIFAERNCFNVSDLMLVLKD